MLSECIGLGFVLSSFLFLRYFRSRRATLCLNHYGTSNPMVTAIVVAIANARAPGDGHPKRA